MRDTEYSYSLRIFVTQLQKRLIGLATVCLLITLLAACQPEGSGATPPLSAISTTEPRGIATATPGGSGDAAGAAITPSETVVPSQYSAITTEVLIEQVIIPPTIAQTYKGTCINHSEIVPSLAAWRCEVTDREYGDTTIVDPCLVQPDGAIVCDSADIGSFFLELTAPLPSQDLTTDVPFTTPWLVTVTKDPYAGDDEFYRCTLDLTQTIVVDGRPARYTCDRLTPEELVDGGKIVILGEIRPGEMWSADLAWIEPDGTQWRIREEQEKPLRLVRTFISPLDTAFLAGFVETDIIDYTPSLPEGPVQEGTCWTNALSVNNSRAWRCTVDDEIHDPCFEVSGEPDKLVCDANPLNGNPGFSLQLAETLPMASSGFIASELPWLVELEEGTQCTLATGATGTVEATRVSYLCDSSEQQQVVLLGDPQEGLPSGRVTKPLWSAERAILNIDEEGIQVIDSDWAPLHYVVRGPQSFTPLSCGGLARDIAPLTAAETLTTTTTFDDYVHGQRGTACQVVATGDGTTFQDALTTLNLLRAYFESQDWTEDVAYLGAGPTGEASGFRSLGGLCLVDVGWAPAPDIACPEDQPITACDLTPDERLYTVSIACAQDIYAESILTGGYALGPARPERIEFATGGTEALWSGQVAQGEVERYVFRAMEKQTAIIEISAPIGNIGLTIVAAPDGASVLPAEANSTRWSGSLPATRDYVIRIAGRDTTTYTARLIIPRTLSGEKGFIYQIEGTASAGTTVHYLLEANGNDIGKIAVETTEGQAVLAIYGLDDGRDLLNAQENVTTWEGRFPTTQQYLVEVSATEENTVYTLTTETGADN